MMTMAERDSASQLSEPASAVRVRVTAGPDESVIGKIGYLFHFAKQEYNSYIVTVTETEVRRLHLNDGYEYRLEEI
jgi:hypothetical protein